MEQVFDHFHRLARTVSRVELEDRITDREPIGESIERAPVVLVWKVGFFTLPHRNRGSSLEHRGEDGILQATIDPGRHRIEHRRVQIADRGQEGILDVVGRDEDDPTRGQMFCEWRIAIIAEDLRVKSEI